MRTVREMARVLGWPEARKQPDHVHYPLPTVPAPVIADGPVFMRLEQAPKPRLRVWRSPGGLIWFWRIKHPDGWVMEGGHHSTHAEALAVGLAALDAAHARTRR